ncbi:MAG: isocitrate/isopropylmalate family dehydrogenase, partial [Sphingomicrobium sp.]
MSTITAEGHRARLTRTLEVPCPDVDKARPIEVGVFLGEGVGPEVVPVAIDLLEYLADHDGRTLKLHQGGLIGLPAKQQFGSSLSSEVINFAGKIFSDGGALFCGPGGDRFVYEIRREFDLYCKFTPLEPLPELRDAGVVRPETVACADIIAVRENMGGIYQGIWDDTANDGERVASHRFEYREADVRRIMGVSMRLAKSRRNQVHVV